MSTASYTISTTSYDSPFSANGNYPDHSLSVLETLSLFTSTSHENKVFGYTLDPDMQRNDSAGTSCDANTIFYTAINGSVGVQWYYKFTKTWLNNGNTTDITYYPSISPDNAWLTWTDNNTRIDFTGTATDGAHADDYVLTIEAKYSNNTVADTYTTNFTINGNQPPTIGNLWSPTITVLYATAWVWDNGETVIQDPENDPLNITLYANATENPSWISINSTTYGFKASPTNPDAGTYVITVSVNDGYNTAVNNTFSLTVVENYDPDPKEVINNVEVGVNEYISVEFLPIKDLFADPENRPMTPSLLRYSGDALPSFLAFNVSNNTMYGTPTKDDVRDWLMAYIATNDNGYSDNITFTLSVKP